MSVYSLTADIDLRYKLRELPGKDGYVIKAGQSIRILKDVLGEFKAVDAKSGKPTNRYSLTKI